MPLIDATRAVMQPDEILSMIAKLNGNIAQPKEITKGVYEIGHFGGSHWPPGFSTGYCYGVCDNYEQVLKHYKDEIAHRNSIITLTAVEKKNQEPQGGWRWHKWGDYIGTQKRSGCEYLYDEPEIEKVYVYHVYFEACKGPHVYFNPWKEGQLYGFLECKNCGETKYVKREGV